jgi:Putative adhesin
MRHLSLLALAAAVPMAAFAQSDFNWPGALNQGQTLEIKGVNGSIRAELATGNMIEVSAHKTANRSDPASVRIEVVSSSNGITICSVYPSPDSRPNTCEPAKGGHSNTRDNDVSVDFTVKLPAGVRFAPQAVNGGVTALGLRSDVDASSVNGNVKVETTGLVHASSVNGSIEATMGATSWSGPLGFSTVNGSIDVTMPPGINAEVHATSVSGSLKSDFPMNLSGEISKRNIHGRIGAGGQELKLSTVNGAITLHQSGRAI